jgi:serine kinase of HPr protein (carbohydrate metabolism regulator)
MSGATIHASCVVLGEAGVLIRGASGAGKSSLAHVLTDEVSRRGGFARLVCDDRVRVERRSGRLLARAVPPLEGCLEVRGVGLLAVAHEPAAVVRLLVDCLGDPPARLPEDAEQVETVQGVVLPRLAHRVDPALARIVLWRLRDLHDTVMAKR